MQHSHHPLRIAVTGGIACGKTVVTDFFKELGVPVFDTDIISRELQAAGSPLLKKLAERFGRGILNPDGSLNRRALRLLVFSDDRALADLNALTHPAIMDELSRRVNSCDAPYALMVIPLFFEGTHQDIADRVLVIDVNEETQLKRLMARDGVTEEVARSMIASQVSRATRRERADDLIDTSGGVLADIRAAVVKLHDNYIAISQRIFPPAP